MPMTSSDVQVAQVILSLEPGGTEKLVVDLVASLSRSVGLRVYCLDRAGEWADTVRRLGTPVEVIGRRAGFDLRVAARIARLARAHGVDVLHCHQYTPFVYGRLAALGCSGLSVVFTEHGRNSDAPPSRRRRIANRVLGRLPGPIFAVSADLRRFMAAEGFPPGRVGVIHNGIDPGLAPAAGHRRVARDSLGIAASTFVVGTAARLDPVKNLGLAVSAFARATADRPDACFVVIGDGPERAELERLAAECGIAAKLLFLGYRADVRTILPALDVYVNSSLTEGISVTILEAMAAAVPVVATAVGGTPEIFTSGVDGLLASPGDVADLERQLRFVADRPATAAAMGAAARERIVRAFTARQMVDSYLEVYRELAARRSAAHAVAPGRV